MSVNSISKSEKNVNEDAIAIARTSAHTFETIKLYNLKPDRFFEPVLDERPDFWMVADGASGLTKADHMHMQSDAGWFSHFLCAYMICHHDPNRTLSELLEEACLKAANRFEACPEIEQPSCAIAILRKNPITNHYDYLVLGDCVLLIEQTDHSVKRITDPSIGSFDQIAIDEMKRLSLLKQESFLEQRPSVHSLLVQNRSMKNKPDGYAIADLSADWLGHELTGTLEAEQFFQAALYSDGFDQLQSFLHLSNEDFAHHLFSFSADDLVDELFKLQEQDADCSRLPRLKKRDDTSLILVPCESETFLQHENL